jgi:hypothetical protein
MEILRSMLEGDEKLMSIVLCNSSITGEEA